MTGSLKASNDLEVGLLAAVERGDIEPYLHMLRDATVYIPGNADDLGPGPSGWPELHVDGLAYVPVFTSAEALLAGTQWRNTATSPTTLSDLAKNWPNPDWGLAVNPGGPTALYVPGSFALSTGVRLGAVDPREVLHLPDVQQDGYGDIRNGTFVGQNEAERALAQAMVAADGEAAVRSMLSATLFMLSTEKDGATAPGQGGFGWITLGNDEGSTVPVYTSRERMQEAMGHRAGKYMALPISLTSLSDAWPDNELSLTVNPGLPLGWTLPGPGVLGLTKLADDLGMGPDDSDFRPGGPTDDALLDAAGVSLALYYQPGATLASNVEQEQELLKIAASGDRKEFLAALFRFDDLRLTMSEDEPSGRYGGQTMPWLTRPIGERTVVPVFTSVSLQREVLGRAVGSRSFATLANLLRYWPDPSWDLAINPGTPIGALLPADQIRPLSQWRDQLAASYRNQHFPVTQAIDFQLHDAARRGDRRTFMEILRTARVTLVHHDRDADRKLKPGDVGYPWAPKPVRGRPSILVFTTPHWQSEAVGTGKTALIKFGELAKVWPDSNPDLVLNPASPISVIMTAEEVRAFAANP